MWIKKDGLKLNLLKILNDITRPFRSFAMGIKNLIVWFPIIWNDKQWDYHYMLEMIDKKLELMNKFFNSENTWSADAKIYATQMQNAREHLKYIIDEDMSAFDEYYNKYPMPEDFEEAIKQITKGHPELTEEENLKRGELYLRCSEKQQEISSYHHREFFKIFQSRLKEWWD